MFSCTNEGGCCGHGAPDAERCVAGTFGKRLAAGGQSIECKSLICRPECGTEEPGQGPLCDGVAVVLVVVNLLLQMEDQVAFLADLNGEMDECP